VSNFIQTGQSLINAERLLSLQHKPELNEGVRYSPEHYDAMFDTGQRLRLTLEEGAALMAYQGDRDGGNKPPAGTIATTSETAK
jgi:hypothetical protein